MSISTVMRNRGLKNKNKTGKLKTLRPNIKIPVLFRVVNAEKRTHRNSSRLTRKQLETTIDPDILLACAVVKHGVYQKLVPRKVITHHTTTYF